METVPTRERLLTQAARLFAERGFHGVSIEDLGAAAGISGPAVYRHFASKDAVLGELLAGISEHLLAGGRAVAAGSPDAAKTLEQLLAFHLDFALSARRDLIRVQDRDLANLSETGARHVRRLQRSYLEVWVAALLAHRELPVAEARLRVQAVIGMLNSTPHSAGRDLALARRVLSELARASLDLPAA